MNSHEVIRLFGQELGEIPIEIMDNASRIRFPVDIVEVYEQWLGRKEEFLPQTMDSFGRIQLENNIFYNAGLGQIPVAERLANLIYHALSQSAEAAGLILPQRRLPRFSMGCSLIP